MENEKLPTIPTPVAQRWREFRIQVVPFIVFLAVLAAIVYLWKSYVQPVGVIGFVETNAVNVTSLQDGLVSELHVERFQNVTTGQVIAVVVNTDPLLIEAQITALQADLQVMRERLLVDRARTEQSYEQMRQELQIQRVTQATEKAKLFLYSNDFVRATQLFNTKSISDAQFDAAKAQYDANIASIQQLDT